MTVFETISAESKKRHLRFLVIGGLATNLYGYSRETADLDILIQRENRVNWQNLFSGLGYVVYKEGQGFLQLSPPKQSTWPVDLMLVREKTFEPMFSAGREVNLYGIQAHIPSLEHLLMLKLHALKNASINRFLKDFLDVENLIRINRLDIKSENIKQLFVKYGTEECMKKYPLHSPTTDWLNEPPTLELPVDPSFVSRPPQIDPGLMLRRIEENMAWRNSRPGEMERRAAEKVPVEFVL